MKKYKNWYKNLIQNARLGNKNTLGRKLSKEHKAKISLSLVGNKYSVGRKLPDVIALREGHKRYFEERS